MKTAARWPLARWLCLAVCLVLVTFVGHAVWWSHPVALLQSSSATVAFCLVVKDDADVVDWVDYHHRRLGVSRFYIFDHGSNPRLSHVLARHIRSGLVVYEYAPYHLDGLLRLIMARPNPQADLFDRCLRLHRDQHRWLAFLDVDEFVVVRGANTSSPSSSSPAVLADVLEDFQQHGGLALNWMVFGSSGLEHRPPSLAHYNACFPSVHVKTIVNTQHVLGSSQNPHWFLYKSPFFAVGEKGDRVDAWSRTPPSFERIFINHYSTKSRQDFAEKRKRGRGSKTLARSHTAWAYFDETNRKSVHTCPGLDG